MSEITILDGGMGKELHRIGAPFRQPEWSALALWEDHAAVATAHRNFIEAGAQVATTNTYAVVPYHIGQERFDADGAMLVERAARIARDEADSAAHPVLVAGSLPPLFGSYQPELFEPDRAPEMYRMMVEAQAPFVDVWVAETIGSLAEFSAVAQAVSASDLPFWAAFSLQEKLVGSRAVLHSGEAVCAAAEAAAPHAQALLFNCAPPEMIGPAIAEAAPVLAARAESIALGAYANAFPDHAEDNGYAPNAVVLGRRHDLTAARYADVVAEWVDLGASIVGGCCGMHPEHIQALAQRFGSAS